MPRRYAKLGYTGSQLGGAYTELSSGLLVSSLSGHTHWIIEFVQLWSDFVQNGCGSAANLKKIDHFVVIHRLSPFPHRTWSLLADDALEAQTTPLFHAAAGRASGDPSTATLLLAAGP